LKETIKEITKETITIKQAENETNPSQRNRKHRTNFMNQSPPSDDKSGSNIQQIHLYLRSRKVYCCVHTGVAATHPEPDESIEFQGPM
jgi:hypothetical protein